MRRNLETEQIVQYLAAQVSALLAGSRDRQRRFRLHEWYCRDCDDLIADAWATVLPSGELCPALVVRSYVLPPVTEENVRPVVGGKRRPGGWRVVPVLRAKPDTVIWRAPAAAISFSWSGSATR